MQRHVSTPFARCRAGSTSGGLIINVLHNGGMLSTRLQGTTCYDAHMSNVRQEISARMLVMADAPISAFPTNGVIQARFDLVHDSFPPHLK